MRLIALASVVLAACLAARGYAADLPLRQTLPPAPYVPSFTWTGFYAGLNAGAGWANARDIVITGPTPGSSGVLSGSRGEGAFVGGGQIGYNWQSGAVVYGLETDIQYVGTGGRVAWGPYAWWSGNREDDGAYVGTVRGRLGYAIDRTLLYVTGGLAYGGLNSNPLTGNNTGNVGWTLGGGGEYAFTNNWSVKLEGLYVDLSEGRRTRVFNNPPGGVMPAGTYTAATDGSGGAGLVRAGVNYKF